MHERAPVQPLLAPPTRQFAVGKAADQSGGGRAAVRGLGRAPSAGPAAQGDAGAHGQADDQEQQRPAPQ